MDNTLGCSVSLRASDLESKTILSRSFELICSETEAPFRITQQSMISSLEPTLASTDFGVSSNRLHPVYWRFW